MAHAEKCPICEGKGTLYEGWFDIGPNGDVFVAAEDTKEVACRGCGGKGWVEISDECGLTLPTKMSETWRQVKG